jgi:four helix bundle protein
MEKTERKYDLEDRLVAFAGQVIDVVEKLPTNLAAKHLASQLVRSGTAPALNYAEAVGAESKADFVHKMGVALKELRETRVCLRILQQRDYNVQDEIAKALNECEQLVFIVSKGVKTAKENLNKRK